MKIALQLYSVRNTLFDNLDKNLRKIKQMGYDGAEIVNFGGDTVRQIISAMSENELEVFSIHTDINEILRCDEEQLALYKSFGCRYMPIGWLPEERLAGGSQYKETLSAISDFAVIARKYGIRVLYHNHDFDFALTEGRHKLDVLFADLPADILAAELDTCWIYTGGEKPLDYLIKYSNRCPVMHLKDCVKEGGRKGFRALSEGVLDFKPIVSASGNLGVEWLCVEQDEPSPGKNAFECAEISCTYLRKLL